MELAKRLEAIIAMVPSSDCVADIGCDHGYTAMELVRRGIVKRAIACDLRQGPLQRAREHIMEAGLSRSIETRLSDGLQKLEAGEASVVILAGMGGELISRILEDRIREFPCYVLSPHSHPEKLRRLLLASAFTIEQEEMAEEDGHYYPILRAQRRNHKDRGMNDRKPEAAESEEKAAKDAELSEEALYYGGLLLKRQDPTLRSYLLKEERRLNTLFQHHPTKELEEKRRRVERGLSYYDDGIIKQPEGGREGSLRRKKIQER